MVSRFVPSTPVAKRLFPLHIAAFLQGVGFWVPVEKLFMDEIGFDAATIGLMAAVYAGTVPIAEVPSGVLADRWSRRGVLILSSVALTLSSIVWGFSYGVPVYLLGAVALGVYFAMSSGTMDAVVYDTVLEETGDSATFEKHLGRLRATTSASFVSSALLGGWLASLLSTRATFFLTAPLVALSIVALFRFREPRLHQAAERSSLREHVTVTYQTLTRRGQLLPIVLLGMLTAMIMQVVFEFGPLWLVALAVPAVLYGPYWAGLMSTLGLGGLLAARLRLERPMTLGWVGALMVVASLALTTRTNLIVVATAQILLVLLMATIAIHVTRLLHDAVPSTIRTGVASGVSTFSWLAFLPFALVFGVTSKYVGVHGAGWMVVAFTVLTGLLLVKVARRPARPEMADSPSPAMAEPVPV